MWLLPIVLFHTYSLLFIFIQITQIKMHNLYCFYFESIIEPDM